MSVATSVTLSPHSRSTRPCKLRNKEGMVHMTRGATAPLLS
jgi:hypothetical protein